MTLEHIRGPVVEGGGWPHPPRSMRSSLSWMSSPAAPGRSSVCPGYSRCGGGGKTCRYAVQGAVSPRPPAELLRRVADRATAKGETIHNKPFEVSPDMVADAIRAADALGRNWKKSHGDERPK